MRGAEIEKLLDNTHRFRVDFGKIKREPPDFQPGWNLNGGACQIDDAVLSAELGRTIFSPPGVSCSVQAHVRNRPADPRAALAG